MVPPDDAISNEKTSGVDYNFALDDRYTISDGIVYLTGMQALKHGVRSLIFNLKFKIKDLTPKIWPPKWLRGPFTYYEFRGRYTCYKTGSG